MRGLAKLVWKILGLVNSGGDIYNADCVALLRKCDTTHTVTNV